MQKNVIKDDILKESYIKLKHKTGLTILLYPMEGYSTATAIFATRYGSIDRTFKKKTDREFMTVPDGIAHYLEHKLFENSDGVDTFELFSKTGASVNAFTSHDKTAYHFSCTNNFNESLKILLNFVQDPYFTDETVQKEQGIIGQEIKMYEDDPNWRVFLNCLENMYHNHAIRVNIAGTVESIAKINKDILYECYKTFYNMNNMVLIISGFFDVNEAIEIIESEIKDSVPVEIERKVEYEPQNVVKPVVRIALAVSKPQFCIGYKLAPLEGIEMLKAKFEFQVACELLVGEGSDLYKEFYDSGLVSGGNVDYEVLCGNGYFSLCFTGESSDPEKVLSKINSEIARKLESGFSEEDFRAVKNAAYGYCMNFSNSPKNLSLCMLNAFIEGYDLYDNINIVRNLKFDEVESRLRSIDVGNSTLSVVDPI